MVAVGQMLKKWLCPKVKHSALQQLHKSVYNKLHRVSTKVKVVL